MRRKFTINEILFEAYIFCAIVGGIFKCVIGRWEPIYDTYRFVSQGRIGTLLSSLSFLILLILIFRCNIKYQKQMPKKIVYLNTILLCYYFVWTMISLRNNSIQSVFFDGLATSIILLTLTCSLGFDSAIWNIVKKRILFISSILGVIFFLAVFSFWGQYGMKWPTNASYKGVFTYWITSVWILTFIYYNDKKKRKIIYLMNSMVVIAAFITQSRAWVLQTLILLFVTFVLSGRRNKGFKILMGCLLVLIALVGISYIFPNVTGSLFKRGLEDTRSGQYVVFFSQHKFSDLFLGLGLNATYRYLGNSFYPYFDNQFMFIMFHYGMLPVTAWLTVYFSLFKRKRLHITEDIQIAQAAKYVGTFVLMAYLGLSTYYQIELGYSSVLIMILFGNAIKRIYARR